MKKSELLSVVGFWCTNSAFVYTKCDIGNDNAFEVPKENALVRLVLICDLKYCYCWGY